MLIFSFAILLYFAVVLGEHDAEDPESLRTMESFWKIGTYLLAPSSYQEDLSIKQMKYEFENSEPQQSSPVKVKKIKRTINDFARFYLQRVLRKGAEDVKSIGEYLRKKLYLKKELVSRTVDELTYRFSAKLRTAFRFILFKLKYDVFEKQYILLDMVNVARFLLNSVGNKLQRKLFAIAIDPPYKDHKFITQTISTYNLDFKRHELKYICMKVAVCRPCPAFSDYFATIINVILTVIDAKFQYLLVKSANLLATKKNLLETYCSKRVSKWFLERAKNVGNESIMDMRAVFAKVRSTLSLRHKMLLVGDGTMKKEVKALRILIDIIDSAFERTENNYLAIQYRMTVSALQDWVEGTSADVDDTLSVFINYIVNTLAMALSDRAKEEMKVLSEVIFDGDPADLDMAKYLLENGSNFLRGLDNHVSYNIWDTKGEHIGI